MRNAISNLLSPKKTITNSYNESSSVNVNEPDRRSSFSSAASNLSFSALRGRSPFLEEKESFDEENFLIDLDDISEPLPSIKRNLRMSDFEDCVMYAEGTNAVLYKARLGSKEVILKMMKPEATNCKGVLHEFDIEEKILERCDHPNIVKFYGSGWDPRKFMVLEFLEEGTLGDLLQRTIKRKKEADGKPVAKSMSFEEALERGKELASALNYIHCECTTGVSIIHRDLKPDNIGIDCDGTLKVIDFGLSICVKRRTNNTSAYKMTGRTGTMRYMCPEVALGQKYSEKVDVYSFAIILWQMVADSIPYKKITKDIFFDAVARGGERPPLNSHWPEAFCELLESCWAESQETRPSFDIVMKVLDEIIAEEESESKRDYSRK